MTFLFSSFFALLILFLPPATPQQTVRLSITYNGKLIIFYQITLGRARKITLECQKTLVWQGRLVQQIRIDIEATNLQKR